MDKILKPQRLALEPSSPGVEPKYKHWKKTFTNYLAQTMAKTDEHKLKILFNCVAPHIFSSISHCEKYDVAISILDSLFLLRSQSILRGSHFGLASMPVARKTQMADGDHTMLLKLKSTEENLNNKMMEIAQLKKKLREQANIIKQEQNALRMMETKKIAIAHKVTIFEGQIDDLKEEKKLMVNLVEELRAELALKESAITKKELALRKIQTQKDSLQEDVNRWQDANKESKHTVNLLQENLKDARNFLKEREFDIEKLSLDNKHLITERDIAKQQVKTIKEDNKKLNLKLKSVQKQLHTEKAQNSERLDDIRLMKLDCDNLRKERSKLIKIIDNTADHQSTIFNLEKDLLRERLMARTLEEELQKPINGVDPSKLELQQKNYILKKKLLKEMSDSQEKGEKLAQTEQKCEMLSEKLNISDKENEPNICDKLRKMQNDLRKKGTSLKLQKTKTNCLVSQNAKLKLKLEMALKKLNEMDRLPRLQQDKKRHKKLNDEIGKIEQTVFEDDEHSCLNIVT
ncbi:hypothetical protein LSTR_LSTR010862 [Laodelphax striatellus]|uniref:Cilia- and flagella-associated protein 58 central coiled coil domain-containing protein n=1 Tax=Laodelphax striatellus TaxID=195883 RepID=A0A482WNA5_LAOST|nr:hypothetical protein LSTR_LSTR010862 [Laodelphax striatellus]